MTSVALTAERGRAPSLLTAFAALAMLVMMAFAAPGLAHAQTTVTGLITQRIGPTMIVHTDSGDVTITVTDATKIRGTEGVLGIRGQDHPSTDLIRGLPVQVTTVQDGSTLTATAVTFKEDDLKTAQQIAAGITTTQAQVAANSQDISQNSQRINEVGQYAMVSRTNVYFGVGSAVITQIGKQDLQAMATKAKTVPGFRLVIVGRASPTGNAAANQRLSDQRAAAVQNYLLTACAILPTNILPVTGLGDQSVAQDPNPPLTDAQARRVTVTVVVSKASQVPPAP